MRHDNRRTDELRPVKITRDFTNTAAGSVLIEAGETMVLCTASVELLVPPWMAGKGRGWVTAEYCMLPSSTNPRKRRDRGRKIDSRSTEIQRLIGRSLRAITDLDRLGERTVAVDCEVLQADGGTRTAAVTGSLVALVDAIRTMDEGFPGPPSNTLLDSIAAVSVGMVNGQPVLDLDYKEDAAASVDMNVVMTGGGRFVELQGTGEEATFSEDELTEMLRLARLGIEQLRDIQQQTLGNRWSFA